MQPECISPDSMPGTTPTYRAALHPAQPLERESYPTPAAGDGWLAAARAEKALSAEHRAALADLLREQNAGWGADAAVLANIERLRKGADAVVTGQQVTLFGGPLLTMLKAASAVRQAQKATEETGRAHVPIFWLASEDHDFAEINHVAVPSKNSVETVRVEENAADAGRPVGARVLGDSVKAALEQVRFLLAHAPVCDALEAAYTPQATMADAFAKFLLHVFAGQGLIVMDAAGRGFHALGAATLRAAISDADALLQGIAARSKALESAGLHAQVTVVENGSLLFLIDAKTGVRNALRRSGEEWIAGGEKYSTAELLKVLEEAPERLSPNALLRPVFQDTVLPTSAYIGGPAEIAYFAQSQVVYAHVLGRTTPILPRLSATLVENAVAHVMERYGLTVADVWAAGAELAQKLGARAMPIEGKRKLAAAGEQLSAELEALTQWMHGMDENLGKSADVAANKMRYQMNRLRRMAANFELQKEGVLEKHATQIEVNLYPQHRMQERVLAGAFFAARYGDGLAALLAENAADNCGGHKVIVL